MKSNEIASFFKNEIKARGITIKHISETTGIGYQRLCRIFNYGVLMNAEELLNLCGALCSIVNRIDTVLCIFSREQD